MRNMINTFNAVGYLYEHALMEKITGPKSKSPNTPYITGTVSIATDEQCLNVVQIHYSYVTATTASGAPNATYATLKGILDGTYANVMQNGKESAVKVRVDSAVALNEFYTDRNGKEELVSAKRNEGGFIHIANPTDDFNNKFTCDMIITNVSRVEANEEKNQPEKMIIKGAIFDFRKALMPVEFTATNPAAMDYFESQDISSKNPLFTKVWGKEISETVVTTITEESAFGEPSVREVRNSRKDFLMTGATTTPYEWDVEGSITVTELNEAIAARETYLATLKQRQDEYKASKNQPAIAAPAAGAFNF
jgi:hypothetical protein